eukprot:722384-Pelagomonas_calceolata.AAC.1
MVGAQRQHDPPVPSSDERRSVLHSLTFLLLVSKDQTNYPSEWAAELRGQQKRIGNNYTPAKKAARFRKGPLTRLQHAGFADVEKRLAVFCSQAAGVLGPALNDLLLHPNWDVFNIILPRYYWNPEAVNSVLEQDAAWCARRAEFKAQQQLKEEQEKREAEKQQQEDEEQQQQQQQQQQQHDGRTASNGLSCGPCKVAGCAIGLLSSEALDEDSQMAVGGIGMKVNETFSQLGWLLDLLDPASQTGRFMVLKMKQQANKSNESASGRLEKHPQTKLENRGSA